MSKRQRKGDVVNEIAAALAVQTPPMSTGSTEPAEIFRVVNYQLGLGLDPEATKPQLARGIVEASGEAWHPDYESRGATITLAGLQAVFRAVSFFVGSRASTAQQNPE